MIRFAESLGLTSPDYYYYLNQSATYKVDGMDDNKEFNDTFVSMHIEVHTLCTYISSYIGRMLKIHNNK